MPVLKYMPFCSLLFFNVTIHLLSPLGMRHMLSEELNLLASSAWEQYLDNYS